MMRAHNGEGWSAGAAAPTPSTDPQLVQVMSRIQDATARVSRLTEGTQRIADNVFGPQKDVPASSGLGPSTAGSLSLIWAAIDHLHERIGFLELEAQRLEAL